MISENNFHYKHHPNIIDTNKTVGRLSENSGHFHLACTLICAYKILSDCQKKLVGIKPTLLILAV